MKTAVLLSLCGPVVENAQATKNQIGPIQYFPAETPRQFSTIPVSRTEDPAGEVNS